MEQTTEIWNCYLKGHNAEFEDIPWVLLSNTLQNGAWEMLPKD